MITAEFSHNPYLSESLVKFNGNPPRINSQIEKYESLPLKDWVHKIPDIFHDEMNGYDFDFIFCGTKSEFIEIKTAFKEAGVSENQVRLFLKNEIEDAKTKSKEIDNLIEWLFENRNQQFDLESFWNENADFFEGTYPLIAIRGKNIACLNSEIDLEVIENTSSLESTDLMGTPIIFTVKRESLSGFRKDLEYILERKDVRQEQLFFMIRQPLDKAKISRLIHDLGVAHPQIVNGYEDSVIMRYMQNYPVTDYISTSIRLFHSILDPIETNLKKKNEESADQNAEIHTKLDDLTFQIEKLKKSLDFFKDLNQIDKPKSFQKVADFLFQQIVSWRNRKVKMIGADEIQSSAIEYEEKIQKYIMG